MRRARSAGDGHDEVRKLALRVRALTTLAAAATACVCLAYAVESRGPAEAAPQARVGAPAFPPKNAAGAAVEQTSPGTRSAAVLVTSFDGLGAGFAGPQGGSPGRNPSDNSLAVGPDHIVQTVNSRLAIFTKKGKKYDTTGTVLYGAVPHEHGLCRLRRHVRSAQQRRRRRALRPARGPLADRDADLPACGGHGPISPRYGRRATRSTSARRECPVSPARQPSCSCRHRLTSARHRRRLLHRVDAAPRRRRSRVRTRCATRSAPAPIRSAPTIATSSCGRSSPTIRARPCGRTATTCRPARATTSSRSMRASSIATACSRASPRPSSAS